MGGIGLCELLCNDGCGFDEERFATVRREAVLYQMEKAVGVRICALTFNRQTYWPLKLLNRPFSCCGVDRSIRRSIKREHD